MAGIDKEIYENLDENSRNALIFEALNRSFENQERMEKSLLSLNDMVKEAIFSQKDRDEASYMYRRTLKNLTQELLPNQNRGDMQYNQVYDQLNWSFQDFESELIDKISKTQIVTAFKIESQKSLREEKNISKLILNIDL